MRRLSVLLGCVVLAMTLIAIAVATGASAAANQQPPPANHVYGALDWSEAKGTFHWGTGTSKESVNQAAYDACQQTGATDCLTIVWVYNGWVALAEGTDRRFAVDWGPTEQAASDKALKICLDVGIPNCEVVETHSTALDPDQQTTGGYELPGP